MIKTGDQFIIEVNRKLTSGLAEELYGIKGDGLKSIFFHDYDLMKLPRATENDDAQRSYLKGLHIVWEAMRLLVSEEKDGGIPHRDVCDMFEYHGPDVITTILQEYGPEEVLKKINAYEETKKVQPGDEVEYKEYHDQTSGIVLSVTGNCVFIIGKSKRVYETTLDKVTKTGRNFADKIDHLVSNLSGTRIPAVTVCQRKPTGFATII